MKLRTRLKSKEILVAPGVFDGLTAILAERAGFEALYLSGAAVAYTRLGRPDIGLTSVAEMAGKIAAMADARASDETLIIARTDAIALEGLDGALTRAEAYLAAGADVLFLEAPRSREELAAVANTLSGRVPLLANMVEGGATPITGAKDLEPLGYSIAIFPGGIVRALARTAEDYYASLLQHGSNRPFADRMFDFGGLNERLSTSELLDLGKQYETFR